MYEQPSSKYGLVIRVDDAVRVAIEIARQPGESINDVLRRKLGLPPKHERRCACCGHTNIQIEDIPDVLPGIEAPLCVTCFGEFEARGWNNLNGLADLPYYNPES